MKKTVTLDEREWWQIMNGLSNWSVMFETASRCSPSKAGDKGAGSKKRDAAQKVAQNYRWIISNIEMQLGQTTYFPGFGEHLDLLL
jgi:hypothetical protein